MIHRRNLIAAAAAVPVAGCAGSFAKATPVDPHPALLEQWRAEVAHFNTTDGADDDVYWEIGKRICMTPAATVAGVLAQVEFAIEDKVDLCFPADPHKALFANIRASLKALS
ncbi:MAG: hypothetical protein OIF55_05120 [Amphritea sp.]|nr:hypothetical protein [Amphritea sp.]